MSDADLICAVKCAAVWCEVFFFRCCETRDAVN